MAEAFLNQGVWDLGRSPPAVASLPRTALVTVEVGNPPETLASALGAEG
ncbi:MAG: hypothetical protein VKJ09_04085 [Leptolyngbya sp.]|nr:hypothetical protein [Leptolyngbya sp.]